MRSVKIISVLLAVLIFAGAFSSCGTLKKDAKITANGATEDEANYPTPEQNNYDEAETDTGMCYSFTLDRFTTGFNTMYVNLGGEADDFPYKKWTQTYEGVEAANGRYYDYYYLDSGEDIILTSVIETTTRRVINLGCGVKLDYFMKNEDNRQRVMTVCGIMAAVAGGYTVDEVPFFTNLYIDTIDSDAHEFWYNGSIYLYEERVNGKDSTILLRTMPAKPEIEAEWNLKDYKDYWMNSKR